MDVSADVMAPRYLRCGLGDNADPVAIPGEHQTTAPEIPKPEDPAERKLGYAASLVQVRNTFIEVQEAGDGGNPQYLHLPSRKRGHLRCASEPMASLSLRNFNEPVSVSSHSGKFPGGDTGIGSLLQAALGEAMGTSAAPPDDGDRGEDACSRSSGSARRTNHLRQASMQTVVTIDEEHDHSDDEVVHGHEPPSIGISQAPSPHQMLQERSDAKRGTPCPAPRGIVGENPQAESHTSAFQNALTPGPVIAATAPGAPQETEAFRKRCSGCSAAATQLFPRHGSWLCLACWKQWEVSPPEHISRNPKSSHIGAAMREPPQSVAPPPLLPCSLPSATSSTNVGAFADWTTQRQLPPWCDTAPWQSWRAAGNQVSQCEQTVLGQHVAPNSASPGGILLAAYAQGFSHGIAANEVSSRNRAAPACSINNTAQVAEQAHRVAPTRDAISSRENPAISKKSLKTQANRVPCKWFGQGTCKFGSACRFVHQESTLRNPSPGTENALQTRTTKAKTDESVDSASISTRSCEPSWQAIESKACDPRRSDASSNSDCDSDRADGDREASGKGQYNCHVVWCDQRAFKEASEELKKELERAIKIPVRAHKTAEKCMRLIQKKKRNLENRQARPPTVFLISWANAPTLVPYLCEVSEQSTKVIVLCDLCGCRGRDHARRWSRHFPLVDCVADSWQQAVEQVAVAVSALQKATSAPV